MVLIENLDHASRPTRREFTREALRSLTAVALIEGLAAHRLQGQRDVRLIEFFAVSYRIGCNRSRYKEAIYPTHGPRR
jgi:hypothetical protein